MTKKHDVALSFNKQRPNDEPVHATVAFADSLNSSFNVHGSSANPLAIGGVRFCPSSVFND